MKTAYTAGCLLTASSGSPVAGPRIRRSSWHSLCASCQGSCHHVCIHGRKEEEGAVLLRSPLLC